MLISSQHGFLQFVCRPFISAISKVMPGRFASTLLERLDANRQRWVERAAGSRSTSRHGSPRAALSPGQALKSRFGSRPSSRPSLQPSSRSPSQPPSQVSSQVSSRKTSKETMLTKPVTKPETSKETMVAAPALRNTMASAVGADAAQASGTWQKVESPVTLRPPRPVRHSSPWSRSLRAA